MGKQESRKTKRAQAARARAREAHVRLALERQGNPAYTQQERTPTGRTLHLSQQDADTLKPTLDRQLAAFVAKFGREPRPDDPLFFDPSKDEPTFMDDSVAPTGLFDDLRAASQRTGVDPSMIDAWEEVGYVVTEANEHLLSAHEVEAYLEAVDRARERYSRRDSTAP